MASLSVSGTKKGLLVDLVVLIMLYSLNPAIYYFHKSMLGVLPDTTSYVTMAEQLFSQGALYLKGWGHIDTGVILPPLYPLLIAIGLLFSSNSFLVAEIICTLCVLIVPAGVYFFASRLSNRFLAALAVLSMQVMYHFLYYGFEPLTEAVFMLTLVSSLYVFSRYLSVENPHWLFGILVGMSASIVFLCRQIGIIFFVYVLLYLIWCKFFVVSKRKNRLAVTCILSVIAGYLLIAFPYISSAYLQTGKNPIVTLKYRMNEYVVSADDPNTLRVIENINNIEEKDYSHILMKRRLRGSLLSDSTEMISHVVIDSKKTDASILLHLWDNKKNVYSNLVKNIHVLIKSLGIGLCSLFVLTTIVSIVLDSRVSSRVERGVVPLFVCTYLLAISFFTGEVARYVYVLIPVVFMQVPIGVHVAGSFVYSRYKKDKVYLYVSGIVLLLFGYLVFMYPPLLYQKIKFYGNKSMLVTKNTSFVDNDQYIFATSPGRSYIYGGKFRTLPNDSLGKIYKYAQLTGVRYLTFDVNDPIVSYYNKARWMYLPVIGDTDRFQLLNKDGSTYLYKIVF